MELAVLKYKKTAAKPANMPDEWPAEVREIADGAALPSADWVRMTVAEYESHRANLKSSYDTWWASNKANWVANEPYT